jgi:hypothetical protein
VISLGEDVVEHRAPARDRMRACRGGRATLRDRIRLRARADKNSRQGFRPRRALSRQGLRATKARTRLGKIARCTAETRWGHLPVQEGNFAKTGDPKPGPVGDAPSRIAGGGKTVGKVVQIGIQRAKEFFKTKAGRFTKTGARATADDLVEAIKAGEDVIADSPSVARDLARTAGGGKAPTLHEVPRGPLEQGFLPHYHPQGLKSHVFFEPKGGFGIKDLLDMFGPIFIGPVENFQWGGAPNVAGPAP